MAVLVGTDGPENLVGGIDNDTIRALGGADQLEGGEGHDLLRGGDGNDRAVGDLGNDRIYGDAGDDELSGGIGNDALYGGGGNDTLWGQESFDELFGGAGNDYLIDSEGKDNIDGGAGRDTLSVNYFGAVQGLSFSFAPEAGPVKTLDGSTVINVERISVFGSNHNDTFSGGQDSDQLRGWQGNDQLFGRGGHDFMVGDNGNDYLEGGNGHDTLLGGGNSDTLVGGFGNDLLQGGRIFDVFGGDDWIEGGRGADTVQGGPGQTSLSFMNSAEAVYVDLELGLGFGGDAQGDRYEVFRSVVHASKFADLLVGGNEQYGYGGDDRLIAGDETSLMSGGDGVDRFVFRDNARLVFFTSTQITDFDRSAGERIDVSGLDARPQAGDQAFAFIGTAAFSGKAGELRYLHDLDNDRTVIQLQADADIDADSQIVLQGIVELTAGDFIL